MFVSLLLVSLCTVYAAAQQRDCKLDVALLIDGSGSIWVNQDDKAQGERNWNNVKKFAGDLVRDFTQNGRTASVNNIAAIKFEDRDDTGIIFQLGALSDAAMISAMRNLPYDDNGGTTRMDRAMELLDQEIFTSSNPGDSPDAQNVAIVITDGKITDGYANDTYRLVNSMKADGVEFIVVGVTDSADPVQLEIIASTRGAVFSVDQFDQLESLLSRIQDTACDIGTGECPAADPYAVAFSALTSNTGMTLYREGMRMPFGLALLNHGQHYDTNNFMFICPCKGIYEFHLTMSYLHNGVMAAIMKNGQVISPLAHTDHGSMSTTAITLCEKGERVYAQVIHADAMELIPCWYDGRAFAGLTGKFLSGVN